MAKKRSRSVQEKKRNTSSTPNGREKRKSIQGSRRNARLSPQSQTTTRSTHSVKRDLKSTRVPSKGSTGNNYDGAKESTKRCLSGGKKRNLSHQESSESPSKKPKIDPSQMQAENATGKKDSSLKGGRKRGRQTKQPPSEGIKEERIKSQASIKKELTSGKNHVKQKSPAKLVSDATPEMRTDSPKKNRTIGKKLKLELVGIKAEGVAVKMDERGSSSDDSSDDEDVAWEDVDEANVADHKLGIGSDKNEASTSHKEQSPSKKSVEISITVPGTKKKKKGWTQEDFMKYIKRSINRYRKDVFTKVHKVHLLALVAHGIFRNGICNDQVLQAVLLSHIPKDFVSVNKRKWDVAQLTNFLKWFQGEFSSIDDLQTGDKETDKQVAKFQNLSEVFVAVLRSLGHLTRLVYSMQPISVKGDLEGKSVSKTLKKKNLKSTTKSTKNRSLKTSTPSKSDISVDINKEIITENEITSPSNKQINCSADNKSDSGQVTDENEEKSLAKKKGRLNKSNCAVKTPKRKKQADKTDKEVLDHPDGTGTKGKKKNKRPLRKRKKVDYSLSGSDDGDSNADTEWIEQESSESEENSEEKSTVSGKSKVKDKTPLSRRKKSTESDNSSPGETTGLSFVDLMDDDSDFEVTSKPLARRRASAGSSTGKKKAVKMISSDESDESVQCLGYVFNEQDSNWWTEVYLPVEKKWICVHLESSSINHPELCEKEATQPLVYVTAFDNKNAVKDVTNRYASSWMSKTRKLRIDTEWWEDTLYPYRSKNKKMVEMEDAHIEDQLLDKPLPTSITEYKNHPLYVLKRHLLKFEAIYPETATILGYCRGEAVYARECVHTLHTREKWLNEALVVKQGETAYKVVKGRPKRNQPLHERDSVTIDLFGRWQTEKYKPPPAKDGKVPRNEYGNVELFLPCMLPPGTKHIQINGIQRVAKKLGIDCAQAVVGFDFHCGFSHPVIDGVVVCQEFEQVLLDAWREEEEQAEKRKAEKREKRMLANWKLLTRSLLIRERLKKRYDTEETNTTEAPDNEESELTTDASVSWPLNRQEGKSSVAGDGHCHVFPKKGRKQDPVTGEWTKSCSCGLTLPFEKM